MKKVVIVVLVLVGLGLVGAGWWHNSLLPVNTADSKTREFVIAKGDGVREIAVKLREAGLIRDQVAFFLLVKKLGLEKNIQAGSYKLTAALSAEELANRLTVGTEDTWITIPEGWRSEEIAEYLSEFGFQGDTIDGRLFPDTYLVPKLATVEQIVNLMQKNFTDKVTFPVSDDQLTVASMVEREARTDTDRLLVASVIYNRLAAGMALDIDATVQYAIGKTTDGWWKKELTPQDIKIDSPYNTYQNAGLPPAPICHPGLASIKAAVTPAKTDYLYYISDKNGKIHFAKTLEEHNANVAKYL